MRDLKDLYYFVAVIDHGGFAAAGRALGLQKSKLSRREERLGVRLLSRSSRRFSVTEIGREYYHRCVAMLVEVDLNNQFCVLINPRQANSLFARPALLQSTVNFTALQAKGIDMDVAYNHNFNPDNKLALRVVGT